MIKKITILSLFSLLASPIFTSSYAQLSDTFEYTIGLNTSGIPFPGYMICSIDVNQVADDGYLNGSSAENSSKDGVVVTGHFDKDNQRGENGTTVTKQDGGTAKLYHLDHITVHYALDCPSGTGAGTIDFNAGPGWNNVSRNVQTARDSFSSNPQLSNIDVENAGSEINLYVAPPASAPTLFGLQK